MKSELQRRAGKTAAILDLFKSKPSRWLPAGRLMKVGGACAWRTRVSDARKIVRGEGGRIDNKVCAFKDGVMSWYRYVPYQPLGPDASTDRRQLSLGGWR